MVAKYHGIFKSKALFCVVFSGKKELHTLPQTAVQVRAGGRVAEGRGPPRAAAAPQQPHSDPPHSDSVSTDPELETHCQGVGAGVWATPGSQLPHSGVLEGSLPLP